MPEEQEYVKTSSIEGAPAEGASVEGASAKDAADEAELVLTRLLLAHEAYFDVSRNYAFGGRIFPGYAEFHSHGEKYVLVKSAKLWEVNSHEYLFFDTCAHLTTEDLAELTDFMKTQALAAVVPEPNHMNSYLSLVVVAKTTEADVRQRVKKTAFRKNFKMGFQGWVDLRLAVVDLGSRQVYTNAMGKELRPLLEANAGIENSRKNLFTRR